MTYDSMRAFADSWGLVAMVVFFVGMILMVFLRPGSKAMAEDAAQIPLRED